MIATIIIVGLALGWLTWETDYFRVRLPYGKPPIIKTPLLRHTEPEDEDNIINSKPADFTPLDIPAMTGSINIICKRC